MNIKLHSRREGSMPYDDILAQCLTGLSVTDKNYSRLAGVQSSVLLDVPDSHNVAASSNVIVEGVHFLPGSNPADLGYKAIVSCYSKLMSFGARPSLVQCSISTPNTLEDAWLESFFTGVRDCREKYGGNILSCNIVQGKHSITIDSMGIVPKSFSGALHGSAKQGDLIYVTGTLGDAGLALQRLLQGIPNDDVTAKYLSDCLVRPKIPLNFSIAVRNITTCSVAIVDGFSKDLSAVLAKNNFGAVIQIDKIPLSAQIKAIIELNAAYQCALTGGDEGILSI